MKTTAAILLILLPLSALANRYLGVLGGSGDPAGATTIFDKSLSPIGSYATESSSQTRVAFNGGHVATEAIIARSFPNAQTNKFSPSTFSEQINQYVSDLNSGAIKAGDQLLLVINSHGSEANPGTKAHAIAAGDHEVIDFNHLNGDTAQLQDLLAVTKLAEQKGVSLAVVDLSCHSGASLDLGNSRTCVITASGPQSYAYGGDNPQTFANTFTSRMKPGQNLEDVFLKARGESRDNGFPMISTPEGVSAQNELYPLIRKYINYAGGKADKFDREINESVASGSCEQESGDLMRINTLLAQVEAATRGVSFASLRAALADYQQYRVEIQGQLKAMGAGHLKDQIEVCGMPSGCQKLSVGLIITMRIDSLIAERESLLAAATPDKRAEAEQWLAYFRNMKSIREGLYQKYPGIEKESEFIKTSQEIQTRTLSLASRVSEEARAAYSVMYQKRSEKNPCRDFVL